VRGIHYENIKGGDAGRLLSDITYQTAILGRRVSFDRDRLRCDLYMDGRLVVYADSEWDFGTFAIDTPAMVYASLEHDAICNMTNARLLPWRYRMEGDKGLWNTLTAQGATVSRFWRVPAVMAYSQLIARWKDKV
jgi:hypothetical protein